MIIIENEFMACCLLVILGNLLVILGNLLEILGNLLESCFFPDLHYRPFVSSGLKDK
jgi:hypothetical protein